MKYSEDLPNGDRETHDHCTRALDAHGEDTETSNKLEVPGFLNLRDVLRSR